LPRIDRGGVEALYIASLLQLNPSLRKHELQGA
jgi:hypothetical protein